MTARLAPVNCGYSAPERCGSNMIRQTVRWFWPRPGTVQIFDPKSNQPPEQYPLKRTPLSLILARDVSLGQADMVVGHDFDGISTVVAAQDPKNPERGRIELMFTSDPVELRKWVIYDNTGSQTTVLLGPLIEGELLDQSVFSGKTRTDTSDR